MILTGGNALSVGLRLTDGYLTAALVRYKCNSWVRKFHGGYGMFSHKILPNFDKYTYIGYFYGSGKNQ